MRVVDGDTIVTTAGTVRIAGIDTPERGQCGYSAATSNMRRMVTGRPVRLDKAGVSNDRDRYGRT